MHKEEIAEIINNYLELVGLEEYKNYYPKDLSGGMKQRINILRAFIYSSKMLIMDEPFKSLDMYNKQIVMDFFKELMAAKNRTCIMVTHDMEEAFTLGDRIVILTEKPTRVKEIIKG